MYPRLFTFAKKFIPKISKTERVALLAGNISIERDIISGLPNLHSYINKYKYQELNIPSQLNNNLDNFIVHIVLFLYSNNKYSFLLHFYLSYFIILFFRIIFSVGNLFSRFPV